ncbi:ArsR/SmtB family transcription factor [Neorhizobium galegae]|uniref:Transcriptional regulator, ArsR family n=1 Tax=Neorhizobium galegae bv. orientalis str. HAMBI 540 TaxID=1028800 RepID=A0A068T0J3_NEOGA|nr:winged helix-turn-helix transcriptional regulator [Neorhizobium galegae]MCQ1854539.1 winged helix-turn-helix transcriptional regulator [Neorhizobium galegae]CDN51893.1 Transcriptional regulator, ArsR family [Neorhizobium galegae bv. orientalis str. HAMBI 540]CDZ51642.1 Transcriptional regulator, ArsR family [Neorhizobium galegae bv. orientalis]
MSSNFLVIDPEKDLAAIKGVSSLPRIKLLKELSKRPGINVNELAQASGLPQSSVSAHLQVLEKAGLVRTETQKARKGNQKICFAVYDELVVTFHPAAPASSSDMIEVSMPLGLYTNNSVTGPCGICSTEGIIGLLDVPETFMDPERMKTSLLWFTSGFVEYQFPNNAKLRGDSIEAIEIAMEVSSEVPGTLANWPSDIVLSINGKEIGVWTSPGDYGDHRGTYTPGWWKLKGSQYGMLKTWSVGPVGTFVDGIRISDIKAQDLDLDDHRSVRLRIEVKAEGRHPGGINIFGRGFGNYGHDIVLRLKTKK